MIKRQIGSPGGKILFVLGVLFSTCLVAVSGVRAETPPANEMEDMRREVRQLRSQVQSLRSAIAEAAELDAQRLAVLTRALKAVPAVADTAPPAKAREDVVAEKPRAVTPVPPSPPAPATVALAPAPGLRNTRRNAEGPRKAAEAPAPTGIVRGKVSVPKGEPVAYVYVENVTAPPVKDQRHVIEQVGKKFVPSWAVVQRGTVISFPNRDNIYHNVFSLSTGNSFDLGLYSGGEAKSHSFNEPGEVEIYCNIHPQMIASTLVVPNRLYAKVKSDGTFEIAGVPPGKRKVVAWAPGSRLSANWVDLDAGGNAQVEFKLESKSSGHKNKAGQAYGSYE